MGKFNNSDGVNFQRTLKDILNSYARSLLASKNIDDEEFSHYTTSAEGNAELLDALLEKLYETELVNGVEVSSVDSFYHYCEYVLHEHHGQRIWNSFVQEMFVSIEHNKNTCIMASRQVGKSFFNYVLYPSYKMFLYSGTKFLHVSNIPTQCVENLRILKGVIDNNEMLYQRKEVWKGKELKWTEKQIEYNAGMLITISAGTSPKGLSVHYVVIDDILTETSQLNDEEMDNYIFGQLYPTVQRAKGRMIVTGTPLHQKDIYHLLMGDKTNFEGNPIRHGGMSAKGFFSRMFPIILDDGQPLLPEIYGLDEIKRIEDAQGDIKFQREYMLNCIDESLTIFSQHLIDSVSDASLKYLYTPVNTQQQFIIGIDVASSGEASADYSAFVVIELAETQEGYKKIVRHIVHSKGMAITARKEKDTERADDPNYVPRLVAIEPGQVDTIVELARRFNDAWVVVEKNNIGIALIQELVKYNVHCEEFITTRISKEDMIRYLVNEMKNKNLWFPEETSEIVRLKKELVNFGVKRNKAGKERMEALSGHDDMVMALGLANKASQDFSNTSTVICQK